MTSSITTANGLVIVTQVLPQRQDSAPSVPAVSINNEQPQFTPGNKLPAMARNFLKREPRPLGTVQIMIGVINLALGLILMLTGPTLVSYIGLPFWAGALYILSGSLAVAAHKRNNLCLIRGTVAMNIISCIVAGVETILLSLDLALGGSISGCFSLRRTNDGYYSSDYEDCIDVSYRLHVVLNGIRGILLVFSALQICVAVSVSTFGCKAVRCDSENQPSVVLIQQIGGPPRDPEQAQDFSGIDVPLLDSENAPNSPSPYSA
ncbi:membrane-spanning 4-domains subfamily A member 4A [Amia ocellicauda]|uniref:membrane-spanning 4-domains subfamily A member 4A n=1 Tax=Amia ocellicauda TaxID=2972642 RepID=UPI00346420C7